MMTSLADLACENLTAIVSYLTLREKELVVSTKSRAWIDAVRDEIRTIRLEPKEDHNDGMNLNKS